MGNFLDRVLYEEFKRLGVRLEDLLHGSSKVDRAPERDALDRDLKALSDEVYQLNRYMISLVRQGNVGLYHAADIPSVERAPWDLELRRGSHGPRVAAWQAALNTVHVAALSVDGRFGTATDTATREFQREAGLPANGIVGTESRAAMDRRLPPIRRPNW